MKQSDRVKKLREKQQQITEAIRAAEAQIATKQKKDLTRSKIILGSALLSMPTGERDALLHMLYSHISERDQHFVTMCLVDEATSGSISELDEQAGD